MREITDSNGNKIGIYGDLYKKGFRVNKRLEDLLAKIDEFYNTVVLPKAKSVVLNDLGLYFDEKEVPGIEVYDHEFYDRYNTTVSVFPYNREVDGLGATNKDKDGPLNVSPDTEFDPKGSVAIVATTKLSHFYYHPEAPENKMVVARYTRNIQKGLNKKLQSDILNELKAFNKSNNLNIRLDRREDFNLSTGFEVRDRGVWTEDDGWRPTVEISFDFSFVCDDLNGSAEAIYADKIKTKKDDTIGPAAAKLTNP